MKCQSSIIKELKTYDVNFLRTDNFKNFDINDIPNSSRKPIEWSDCDQYIKLRKMKCDKKKAIKLCQQHKIYRAEDESYLEQCSVNKKSLEYKKIQSVIIKLSKSISFQLKKIRQDQKKKLELKHQLQDTQIDTKMSSYLNNSFEKFQLSLDKHKFNDQLFQTKFSLNYLTRDQLMNRLLKINMYVREKTVQQSDYSESLQSELQQSGKIFQCNTERKLSKGFTFSHRFKNERQNSQSMSPLLIRTKRNLDSQKSLTLKNKTTFHSKMPSVSDIHSVQHIKVAKDSSKISLHKRYISENVTPFN